MPGPQSYLQVMVNMCASPNWNEATTKIFSGKAKMAVQAGDMIKESYTGPDSIWLSVRGGRKG